MKTSSISGMLRGRLAALLVGFTLVGAAGCGEETDGFESAQDAITGGWVTLDLINGWTNYNGTSNPPAIGMVNGVVTFRGAIKANPNLPINPIAFTLNAAKFANFRPNPQNAFYVRTMMAENAGGTLFYNPFVTDLPIAHNVYVYQDGAGVTTAGPQAKAFTSLDGVAYDKVAGSSILDYDTNVWTSTYGFRQSLNNCSGCGVYGKQVDGFARFQGLLHKLDADDTSGFLFKLTNAALIPGNTVTVPAHFGGQTVMSFGALTIYPNGEVWANGNPFASNSSTSFEGVWFSKTLNGNVALPLNTAAGWHAHSARSVKVGKYGDVVRFQGAISGGNNVQIAKLPAGYAPTKTVKLVGVANGPVPVTISIDTGGNMKIEGIPTYVASQFLSLDGVSFGL